MKKEKGLLILVEKVKGKLNIIKEDFNVDSKELLRDFFDTELLSNQSVALFGENRDKFVSRGNVKVPQNIKTIMPI